MTQLIDRLKIDLMVIRAALLWSPPRAHPVPPPTESIVDAALEGRRRRFVSQLLPSPDADRLVAGFLASPEGRAETVQFVARLTTTS